MKFEISLAEKNKKLKSENNKLKKEVDYLTEQRVNLQVQLKEAKEEYEHCKDFCPRNMSDWNEYQEWWKEKHKDDIQ